MEIQLAKSNQANEVFSILIRCKKYLEEQGIYQWMDNYPTLATVKKDIKNRQLYCAIIENQCVGAISINDEQAPEYAAITWNNYIGEILVLHRLAVDPSHQGNGIAKLIMNYAEQYGIDNNFLSIRLDAFSGNKRSLQFYENRGYQKRGEVYFPGRELPFFCYEKLL